MLKFFALLTNSRLERLRAHGPASINKVAAMGMALTGVTIFWFVNVFLIGTNVFRSAPWQAALAGFFVAGIVFTVDRIIVLGRGNGPIVIIMRVLFSLIIAILGGVCMDLVILKEEVDLELRVLHDREVTEALDRVAGHHAERLGQARATVVEAAAQVQEAEAMYVEEINGGPAGSGRYGVGEVAREKLELLNRRRLLLEQAQASLTRLEEEARLAELTERAQLERMQARPTLFKRIEALHSYLGKDLMAVFGWVLLTFGAILFELFPLLIKYGKGRTSYEAEVEAVDRLKQAQVAALLARQEQLLREDARLSLDERRALHTLKEVAKGYA
ncbi:MAG: DUF4407 domain-containing protein [Flavobacteriales bacterium]|nr:DUF4407 domain-containing protein [Flavobacteriales bacterium]